MRDRAALRSGVSDRPATEIMSSLLDDAENRARKAFGLLGDASGAQRLRGNAGIDRALLPKHSASNRPPRRFVQDGEVPTVSVTSPNSAGSAPGTNRLAIAEAELESERQARKRAERELAAAQEGLRGLQTRQAHLAISRDEAAEDLKLAQAMNDRLHSELAVARKAREAAEQALLRATERQEHATTRRRSVVAVVVSPPPPKGPAQPRGRPPGSENTKRTREPKQKPVRWW